MSWTIADGGETLCAVASHVKVKAFVILGAGKAAYFVPFLEDDGAVIELGQRGPASVGPSRIGPEGRLFTSR